MIRVAVLASGSGTNLQAMLDAADSGMLSHGSIVLVVSDKSDAQALSRAEKKGIPAIALDKKQLKTARFETELLALLGTYHIDLVVLAGFFDNPWRQCCKAVP